MSMHIAPEVGSQRARAGTLNPTPLMLWQVPTFVGGLLVFLAVAATIAMRPVRAVREFQRDIARVREVLSRPGEPVQETVELAQRLVARIEVEPHKAGEAHFLLGSLYAQQGERAPAPRADEFRGKALEELQQAEALGVPTVDLPRLQYRMGRLLLLRAGELPRAIDYLNRSIAQGAEDPGAGYGLLMTAYLNLQPPDLDGALKANQKQLEATASEEATAPVRLRRAEILFNKGLRLEAIKVLERIGPTTPPGVRYAARFLQARCCLEEELWNKAVPLWKEVLTNPLEPPANRAHILFVLGQCNRKLDPPDDAGAAVAWQEAVQAGGDEGQAASLSLGELRLTGSNPAAALDDFARALENVKTAGDYHNSLIDLVRVRQLLEQGCRTYREIGDYERAQRLAELYKKLAEPGLAQERYAEISEAWAKDLQEQALTAGTAGAGALEDQARQRFCQAAAAYEQAAVQRTAPEQAGLLWRSADGYTKGRQPARAQAVLETFVKIPMAPERQAEGWFALGEAHKALGHLEEARQAYYKSIEFPTSPVALRARLELAATEIDRKNFDQAEAILRQNLRATSSTPDREAHESSLYLLANLLYQRGEFLKASVLLKEAVRQYPANPGMPIARARLAGCYRKLADEANQKLKGSESYADVQAHLIRARQEWLEQALEVYQKLADHLEAKASKAPGQVEVALLTEASFAVAQCRFDLGELVESLRLYKLLFQRFARQVESLEACVKMYHCYYVMSGPEKANAMVEVRAAVETSLAELPTMPVELFDAPRSGKREDWRRWLGEVQVFLAQEAKSPLQKRGLTP
jgi:tetratricopeptide (TPR) repeat protein